MLVQVFRAAISHLCRLPKPLRRHEGVNEPEKNRNRHQLFQIELSLTTLLPNTTTYDLANPQLHQVKLELLLHKSHCHMSRKCRLRRHLKVPS